MPSLKKPGKKGGNSRGSKSAAKQKDSTEGITGISVRGYKSLAEECNIEIRPLTILAGANSSGKSSAMQPLLLLKQTLEATYDPGALLLLGPNVRFTDAHQLLSKMPGKPAGNEVSHGFPDHIGQSISIDVPYPYQGIGRGKCRNYGRTAV